MNSRWNDNIIVIVLLD